VQLGSAAIFGRAPRPLGLAIYGTLERIAPAPYVEQMLARDALANGDPDGAQAHAIRMPADPARNELLAQVAAARGQSRLALEYYLVAPDVAAVSRYVKAMGVKDPVGAYALEDELLVRLEALTTHPDAVAEAYWTLGRLATRQGFLDPSIRAAAWKNSLTGYRKAVALAPLSEKYWLALGNQFVLLEDWPSARDAFARALGINPNSADAAAGLARAARHGAGPS
jgi:tetratricopeptide (TPR) repeat protein